ncbi:hypothetical protein ACT17_34255 [Mycolicibacterium conceptionense]|uniref:Uncharacterized protein n=1 Tax=Mycolicibacterium conceptionense TaxID=451644 RepID=A0A0J8TWU8_9MYCO|nr:hypothetical protein [Mycolicibacterium conceptionense]KMV13617.1 hypothetical protein ACT17_34255 [Mycolicibacterium conceptionense]
MTSLTETQRDALLEDLDKGTNLFGPLSFSIRSRLCAAVNHPSQDTWDDAHGIILDGSSFTTLWQAVLEHTDYNVRSKPSDGVWPALPTRDQILDGLHSALHGED